MSRGSSTLPSSRTRATAHSMPRVLSHRFAATQSHVRRTNSYPIRSNPESTPQGQADIRPMIDIANGGGLGFGRQDLCQSFRGKTQLWLAAATFVLDSAHGCNAWLARCSAASSSPAAISSDTLPKKPTLQKKTPTIMQLWRNSGAHPAYTTPGGTASGSAYAAPAIFIDRQHPDFFGGISRSVRKYGMIDEVRPSS